MTMELLPETADVVDKSETNTDNDVSCATGVAEVASNRDERQPVSQLPQKTFCQRISGNIDPLFYVVWCLLTAVLIGVFWMFLQHSEQHIDVYLSELKASNAELAKKVADSEINSDVPESGKEPHVGQTDTPEDVLVQPQTLIGTDRSNSDLDQTETASSIQLVEKGNPVDELADLKALLNEKTQQIELLALENHELRLQAEFGNRSTTDASLNVAVDNVDSNNNSNDSVISLNPAQSDSGYKEVEPQSVRLEQLVVNGYNAYVDGNQVLSHDWYSQAIQLDPYHRDANLGVAAAATALGHYKLAADRYRHLLSLDADDKDAFSAMLGLSSNSSMIETELLTHIAEIADDPASLYAITGHYYGQINRWSDAREMFIRSLASTREIAPPADYYFNLAVSFEHTANPDKALEYYLLALNSPGGATFDRALALQQIQALTR